MFLEISFLLDIWHRFKKCDLFLCYCDWIWWFWCGVFRGHRVTRGRWTIGFDSGVLQCGCCWNYQGQTADWHQTLGLHQCSAWAKVAHVGTTLLVYTSVHVIPWLAPWFLIPHGWVEPLDPVKSSSTGDIQQEGRATFFQVPYLLVSCADTSSLALSSYKHISGFKIYLLFYLKNIELSWFFI